MSASKRTFNFLLINADVDHVQEAIQAAGEVPLRRQDGEGHNQGTDQGDRGQEKGREGLDPERGRGQDQDHAIGKKFTKFEIQMWHYTN